MLYPRIPFLEIFLNVLKCFCCHKQKHFCIYRHVIKHSWEITFLSYCDYVFSCVNSCCLPRVINIDWVFSVRPAFCMASYEQDKTKHINEWPQI